MPLHRRCAVCELQPVPCVSGLWAQSLSLTLPPPGVRSMNSTDIQWSAILSWGYADNILRLKSKQSEPPVNFIQSSPQYEVSGHAELCNHDGHAHVGRAMAARLQGPRRVPARSWCRWAPAGLGASRGPVSHGDVESAQLSPRARCGNRISMAFPSWRPPAFCPVPPCTLVLPEGPWRQAAGEGARSHWDPGERPRLSFP